MVDKNYLQNLINQKSAKIGIIGLGQVGLPTALSFSKIGYSVIGHDVNQTLLDSLSNGKPPFQEDGLFDLLNSCLKNKKFIVESNFNNTVTNSDILIVCVPTPLGNSVQPDLSALENVCNSLSLTSLDGKLIVIESSIPPGTMEKIVLPAINKSNSNCWICFVPERLAPGQAFSEIHSTPRMIGYIDLDSGDLAKSLYEKLVTSKIYLTTSKVAEISKLVENTYRDVNVALANEISMICEIYGIDFLDLKNVCNSHPRVNLLDAGPGVGGPCLPKDPYLLLNPPNSNNIDSKIIQSARQINDSMPNHVVEITKNALSENNKSISNAKITILGVSYKANVSDVRLSPAESIISNLLASGSSVHVFDPICEQSFDAVKCSSILEAVSNSDAIILITDHNEFKSLDLNEIKSNMNTPIVIDTRRILDIEQVEKIGMQYYGIGYGVKSK